MVSINKLLLNIGFFFVAAVLASDLRRILPVKLQIREGEDLQLRLTGLLASTSSCYVKTPLHKSYNLLSENPDSENRISYWTENGECGVLAKNLAKDDAGMWRLTAKNSTDTLVDTTFVEILNKVDAQQRNFSIQSGLVYKLILDEESKYCSIHQPHSEETLLVSGECKVELNQPTAAVDGHWAATTGVIGQLREVPVEAELNVFRDRLVTGYSRNIEANTISAYCNLRDSEQGLEFCRFSKPDSAQTGFQLSEGLHSGRYGYYGAGLENGECGITIDAPTTDDYGQWLCSVGVKNEEPFGSLIWINNNNVRVVASSAKVLPTSAVTTILNEVLQLKCEVTVTISYCWFQSPDGEIFTPGQSQPESDEALYRYIGHGFGKGQCGIEIKNAQARHAGQWSCHMGPSPSGFELASTIDVTISETPLAAKNSHIAIADGEVLTIECRTVPTKVTIDYCRFFMPDGSGIHITDDIAEDNPLVLDGTHYWFSSGSLKFGDCGLKVYPVSSKHFGNWTCGAQLESYNTNLEAFDIIVIEQRNPTMDNLTAAATTGIVSAVLILVALLAAGSMFVVKRIKARNYQDHISQRDTISVSANSMSSCSSHSDISLAELQGRRT